MGVNESTPKRASEELIQECVALSCNALLPASKIPSTLSTSIRFLCRKTWNDELADFYTHGQEMYIVFRGTVGALQMVDNVVLLGAGVGFGL
jgi:hypothetical protein